MGFSSDVALTAFRVADALQRCHDRASCESVDPATDDYVRDQINRAVANIMALQLQLDQLRAAARETVARDKLAGVRAIR